MKYTVHFDLKNYNKALKKLSKSTDEEHFAKEAMALIKKQRLYKVALDYFSGQEARLL